MSSHSSQLWVSQTIDAKLAILLAVIDMFKQRVFSTTIHKGIDMSRQLPSPTSIMKPRTKPEAISPWSQAQFVCFFPNQVKVYNLQKRLK